MEIKDLRRDYRSKELRRNDLEESPFKQFRHWFDEAVAAEVMEPNAMIVATATKEGKPSCRTVLMKYFDSQGLVFFTNYGSRKALELENNPFAAVTFFWKEIERQVLIEGTVEKTSRQDSEKYFSSRPRASQLSAWASQQDKVIASRQELEDTYNDVERRYESKNIPLPDFWGGFRLIPSHFEFWQGRPSRLHDRFSYRADHGKWTIERLSP